MTCMKELIPGSVLVENAAGKQVTSHGPPDALHTEEWGRQDPLCKDTGREAEQQEVHPLEELIKELGNGLERKLKSIFIGV